MRLSEPLAALTQALPWRESAFQARVISPGNSASNTRSSSLAWARSLAVLGMPDGPRRAATISLCSANQPGLGTFTRTPEPPSTAPGWVSSMR